MNDGTEMSYLPTNEDMNNIINTIATRSNTSIEPFREIYEADKEQRRIRNMDTNSPHNQNNTSVDLVYTASNEMTKKDKEEIQKQIDEMKQEIAGLTEGLKVLAVLLEGEIPPRERKEKNEPNSSDPS